MHLEVGGRGMTTRGQRRRARRREPSCVSRALQLRTAADIVGAISGSDGTLRQLRLALGFGRDLFAASLVLTQFQPELVDVMRMCRLVGSHALSGRRRTAGRHQPAGARALPRAAGRT